MRCSGGRGNSIVFAAMTALCFGCMVFWVCGGAGWQRLEEDRMGDKGRMRFVTLAEAVLHSIRLDAPCTMLRPGPLMLCAPNLAPNTPRSSPCTHPSRIPSP